MSNVQELFDKMMKENPILKTKLKTQKEYMKRKNKEWKKEHPEKIKEYSKEFRLKNKESIIASRKKLQEKGYFKTIAYKTAHNKDTQKYYLKNREKILVKAREQYNKNKK